MYPVSKRFLAALRQPYSQSIELSAVRRGERIRPAMRVIDGSITMTSGTGVRAVLDATLAPSPGLWAALEPVGVTISASWILRYADGSSESVPLGLFDLNSQSLSYSRGGSGEIKVSAPDIWNRLATRAFETPRVASGDVVNAAALLVRDVLGAAYPMVVRPNPGLTLPSVLTFDKDPSDAVKEVLTSIGYEGYINRDGLLDIRPMPTVATEPVWNVDAGATGVLIGADRTRTRVGTYNVVVVKPAGTDSASYFEPVTLVDNDPLSPTSINSGFGRVPYVYSSSAVGSAFAAQRTAAALLEQYRGLATQLSLEAAPNPALDPGDVILVTLPAYAGAPAARQKHIVDQITTSLLPGRPQQIKSRTTRPTEFTGA